MVRPPKFLAITRQATSVDLLKSQFSADELLCLTQANHNAAAQMVEQAHPDCALIEVAGTTKTDLELIGSLTTLHPHLPIVAFSDHWQVANAVQAMKLGATEVCESSASPGELRRAALQAMASESHDRREYHELIPRSILDKLSTEEARILHLLVQGRTTKEVGATLDVSIRTVHYRKKTLLRKLGVQTRSEAIELIRLSGGSLFSQLEQGSQSVPAS